MGSKKRTPPDPPSDPDMLQALIGSKQIKGRELNAFQDMWDKLHRTGKQKLEIAQRAWVEKRYLELGLARQPMPPPPPVRPAKTEAFWTGGEKPLKPPRKR
jgi:hypothetical protein